MFFLVYFLSLTLTLTLSNLLPKWNPTYQMNSSTIIMICNYSDYISDNYLPQLSKFGIIDIDWSNAKLLWANTQPMDCQERLLNQAKTLKLLNPNSKLMVYRNFVKALPWFTDVRDKILDPNYNEWFLKFKDNPPYNVDPCTNSSGVNKCSLFYHDQLQTPEYPSQCHTICDCGEGLPCGEYLFDHRNSSLREWLTNIFTVNSTNNTGLLSEYIDGYYIDDGWSNTQDPILSWMPKTGFCDTYNKFGGATEEDYKCVQDMGLTADDVNDITLGWRQSMNMSQTKIVELNGYNWQLFKQVSSPNQTECINWLKNNGNKYKNDAILYTYELGNNYVLSNFEIDLGIFLLIRGDYAWIGYSWIGCHSDWVYEWNNMLDKDYGIPNGDLVEISNGVFQRKYTKSVVEVDCNTYKASFNFN